MRARRSGFASAALVAALIAGLLAACASSLRTPCEQSCYAQKSTEPHDFDDCIKRCQR